MTKLSIVLILIGLTSSALARFNLHGQPLLSGVTSFTLEVEQWTLVKPTTCYITSGQVTQCRRKRGMVEKPIQYDGKGKIVPTAVIGIENTPLPRPLTQQEVLTAHRLFSSLDDSYFTSQNIFKQLADRRRSNVITVGDCGMSTVNVVEFLSCLGMTVQETTTLTATFTETTIVSSGYTAMTVMGCTPAGFPYLYCPDSAVTDSTATETSTTVSTTSESSTTHFSTTESTTAASSATVSSTAGSSSTTESTTTALSTTDNTATELATTEAIAP